MPTTSITALVALFFSCVVSPLALADAATVETVRLPEGVHARAAVDADGRLHVLYVKGDPMAADVYYVRSDDLGKSFGKPMRVNSVDGSVVITGTVRGPQIAIGKSGRVHVGWMGSGKAGKSAGRLAPMIYTRLNDAGDAFEPQRDMSSNHPGLDGGGSVAADADGNVYVAWHALKSQDVEGEENRFVWVAASKDEGKTFAAEVAANPPTGVCGCCGMKVFAGPKGRVFVAYRSAEKLVNRDLTVLVSADHGKTFAVAAADPWNVSQCVMSTSSFTSTEGGGVVAAWETQKQIRVARMAADEPKFAEATDVPGPANNRKHPSVAVNAKGETLVAWAEVPGWGKAGVVGWQLYGADGKPVGPPGKAKGLPAWGTAAAVALADGTFRVIY